MALKRTHGGYSEDVLDCLRQARYTAQQLGVEQASIVDLILRQPKHADILMHWYIFELKGVLGIVLLELFKGCRGGAPEEALHLLASSLRCLDDAVSYVLENRRDQAVELGALARYLSGGAYIFPPDLADLAYPNHGYDLMDAGELDRFLAHSEMHYGQCRGVRLRAQDAVAVIERLLGDGRGANWKQIARDCEVLSRDWNGLWDLSAEVVDTQGRSWEMRAYANYARGRAEERLTPSELGDVMRRREDEQAQDRLKTYFFSSGCWDVLPERAQRALVDADRAFVSARAGRSESILEHLKVATEAICYELIWEALRAANKGDQRLLQFVQCDSELASKDHAPALVDYKEFFRKPFLAMVATNWNGMQPELEHLERDFRTRLSDLVRTRNRAQHDPKAYVSQDQVRSLFCSFVGVGITGLLPRLAAWKLQAIQNSRPQAPPPTPISSLRDQRARRDSLTPPG